MLLRRETKSVWIEDFRRGWRLLAGPTGEGSWTVDGPLLWYRLD
jgi:hypothetical protein